jgi:hypothetical protein
MAIQFSEAVRNAMLDAIETVIGTTPIMRIRTGGQPASCAAADSGSVLATINLPSDWLAAASAGTKAKSGTWEDNSADAGGVAGHYRVYDSGGTVCHIQGTVAQSGGDMNVSNTNFAAGQPFTVNTYSISAGNG